MKKISVLCCFIWLISNQSSFGQNVNSILQSVQKKISSSGNSKSSSGSSTLTESEANSGVKELLSTSLVNSVTILNQKDAFWKSAYKIFLPEPLHSAESVLRKIGMGSVADSAELRMNRAAEEAVSFAKPIFINAITQMTLQDAIQLVTGGDNSITTYFRTKTRDTLIRAFTPSIKTELDKTKSTAAYSQVVTKYNAVPLVKKANPDLSNYVAGKTVDALFDQIGKQEKDIRTNPAAQTTSILKSVFGGGK